MSVDAEQVFEFAAKLAEQSSECEWRSAASRAYYAAWHCAKEISTLRHVDKWLNQPSPGAGHHEQVIQKFAFPGGRQDVRTAGYELRALKQERVRADYELGETFRAKDAKVAVASAKSLITAFRAIEIAARDKA